LIQYYSLFLSYRTFTFGRCENYSDLNRLAHQTSFDNFNSMTTCIKMSQFSTNGVPYFRNNTTNRHS